MCGCINTHHCTKMGEFLFLCLSQSVNISVNVRKLAETHTPPLSFHILANIGSKTVSTLSLLLGIGQPECRIKKSSTSYTAFPNHLLSLMPTTLISNLLNSCSINITFLSTGTPLQHCLVTSVARLPSDSTKVLQPTFNLLDLAHVPNRKQPILSLLCYI